MSAHRVVASNELLIRCAGATEIPLPHYVVVFVVVFLTSLCSGLMSFSFITNE